MADATLDYARQWLSRAERDLTAARKLVSGEEPLFAEALFHCQQAIEKALKGFLAYHDVEIEKTHALGPLAREAAQYDPRFEGWGARASRMTSYAVESRYPGDADELTDADFESGIEVALGIYELVLDALPAEARPRPRT
jgi:HEPN domain-containing protein